MLHDVIQAMAVREQSLAGDRPELQLGVFELGIFFRDEGEILRKHIRQRA